jgi:hypothetical protein
MEDYLLDAEEVPRQRLYDADRSKRVINFYCRLPDLPHFLLRTLIYSRNFFRLEWYVFRRVS